MANTRPTLANFQLPPKADTKTSSTSTTFSYKGATLTTNAKKITINFNKCNPPAPTIRPGTAFVNGKTYGVPLNFYNKQTNIPINFGLGSISTGGCVTDTHCAKCCDDKLSGFEKALALIGTIGPQNAMGIAGLGLNLLGSLFDGIAGLFGFDTNARGALTGQQGTPTGGAAPTGTASAGTAPVSTEGDSSNSADTTGASSPSTGAPAPASSTPTPAPTKPTPSGENKPADIPNPGSSGADTDGPKPSDIPNPGSSGAKSEISNKTAEIKTAEEALAEYKRTPTSANEQKLIDAQKQLKAKASEVRGELTNAEANYTAQENAYNTALQRHDTDKETVSTAEKALADKTEARKAAEGFAQEKKTEVDQAQADVQAKQNALDTAKKSIQSDRQTLANKELQLKGFTDTTTPEYTALKKEIDELRAKIQREESELDDKEKALSKSKDKLETAKGEYDKAETSLKKANEEEQAAQNELNGANETLKASANAMNKANADRQKAQAELNRLDTAYRDIEVALGVQPQGIPQE